MTLPTNDLLRGVQEWYAQQCNGEWEHRYGIRIETCDNPGWWVRIDLVRTRLETRVFQPLTENVAEGSFPRGKRWLDCQIKEGAWHGAGDETPLTILQVFLAWTTATA